MIEVAAAVIREQGRTLICTRPGTDFLEFPGGKCEPGETLARCIVRELKEELGISSYALDVIHTLVHAYPEKTVRVHFIRCFLLPDSPAPQALDGQKIFWIPTAELDQQNFLPADLPLASLLAEAEKYLQKNMIPDNKTVQKSVILCERN